MVETPKPEWVLILEASMRLRTDSETARGVRQRLIPHQLTEESITFQDMDAVTVLDWMVPTYCLIKVSVLLDRVIDALHRERLPKEKQSGGRNEKLANLARVITEVDAASLKAVIDLRNECAHIFHKEVTWAEFDRHFSSFQRLSEWLTNQSLRDIPNAGS
jgi:hypothetical protein